jgi:hypothetical protein
VGKNQVDNTFCSLGPHFFDLSKQAIGTMFSRSLSLAILCMSLVPKKCHARASLHTHVKRGVSNTVVVGVHSKDKSERKEVSLSCWLCTKRSTMSTHTVCLDCFFLLQLTDYFRRLQVEASIVAPIEVTVVSIKDGFDKAGKGGCSDVGGKVGTGACLQGGKALTGKSGRGKTGVEKTTKAGKNEEGSIASKISSSTGKASKGKTTKGSKGKKEKNIK